MRKAFCALALWGTTAGTLRPLLPLLAAIGLSATATAAEFPLTLYMPSFVNDGVTDFKTDYTAWSQYRATSCWLSGSMLWPTRD